MNSQCIQRYVSPLRETYVPSPCALYRGLTRAGEEWGGACRYVILDPLFSQGWESSGTGLPPFTLRFYTRVTHAIPGRSVFLSVDVSSCTPQSLPRTFYKHCTRVPIRSSATHFPCVHECVFIEDPDRGHNYDKTFSVLPDRNPFDHSYP